MHPKRELGREIVGNRLDPAELNRLDSDGDQDDEPPGGEHPRDRRPEPLPGRSRLGPAPRQQPLQSDQHQRDDTQHDDQGCLRGQEEQHEDGADEPRNMPVPGREACQPRESEPDEERDDERAPGCVRAHARFDQEVENERHEDRGRVEHRAHPRPRGEAHARSSRYTTREESGTADRATSRKWVPKARSNPSCV